MGEKSTTGSKILGMLPAAGAAYGIAKDVFGINHKRDDRRQLNQQGKLNKQQLDSNKEMADYNHNLQMDIWNKTNYEAQVGKMKEAGINPALMYGGTGAGGTTQAIGGQGVSGGQASGSAATRAADTQATGMALQLGMQKAQMDLIKAQTENVKADTADKGANVPLKGAQQKESEGRTIGQGLENKWKEWLQTPDEMSGGQSPREREFRVTVNKAISEITKIDEELKKIGVDITKGKSEIERINADTNLKEQAYKQLEKLNPLEIQEVTKKLELLLSDPANTEQAQWIKMILGFLGDLGGIGVKGAMTKSLIKPSKRITNIHNWGEN